MRWKLVYTAAAILAFVGVAMADTFPAVITGVENGKVTFQRGKFNKAEKKFEKEGNEMTLPVTSDAKIARGKFDKETKMVVAGEALKGGLKHKAFQSNMVFSRITTNADNTKITEILIFGGKKKQ